jgi:hypothetical protein
MDRQTQPVRDGHHHAPLGGAVQLGQDQPGDPCLAHERLGLRQSVLAGGGVDDQQRVTRLAGELSFDDAPHLGQLRHQLPTVVQAPGGVDENRVEPSGGGRRHRVEGDRPRVGAGPLRDHRHGESITPDAQLFDRRRPECVRRRQPDTLAARGEARRQLGDGGRLPRAVDPDEKYDRRCRAELERRRARSLEARCDLVAQRGADAIGAGDAVGAPAHGFNQLQRGGRTDIRRDQRLLDLIPGCLVAGPTTEDRPQPGAESLRLRPQAETGVTGGGPSRTEHQALTSAVTSLSRSDRTREAAASVMVTP